MSDLNTELFIVIEGLDGTGKSTLAVKLSERLGAICLKTPPDEFNKVRKTIDKTYDQCGIAAQLFYSSTVAYISYKVKNYLDLKQSVVVDRYWLSTCIYAECRNNSIDLSIIETKIIKPDLTVWLDLDEKERKQRIKQRGLVTQADKESFQNRKKTQENL